MSGSSYIGTTLLDILGSASATASFGSVASNMVLRLYDSNLPFQNGILVSASNGALSILRETGATYIGIGNTTPKFALDVAGAINLTDTLYQNSVPYVTSQWITSNINPSGNSNIIYPAGWVGIGNTNPQFALDVTGGINLTGSLYQNSVPYITSQWITSNVNPSGDSNIIYPAGWVGIGNTNPQFALDVAGGINLTGVLYQNSVPYVTSQWITSNVNPSGNSNIIYPTGWVGIGNTNPQFDLDVTGTIRASLFSGSGASLTSIPYTSLTDIPAQVQSDWTSSTAPSAILNKPTLATVATSGSILDINDRFSSNILWTSNIVPIYSLCNTTFVDWSASTGTEAILNKPTFATVAISGSYTDLLNKPALATVATSGSILDINDRFSSNILWTSNIVPIYSLCNTTFVDWTASTGTGAILNKPTIPTLTSQLQNDALFITPNGAAANSGQTSYQYTGIKQANGTYTDTTTYGAERSRFEFKYWTYNSTNAERIGSKVAFISKQTGSSPTEKDLIQSSDILFYTATPNTTNNDDTIERMRIADTGYVGIGNTNPQFALDVTGAINLTGALYQNGTSYASSQWVTSNVNPSGSSNIIYPSGWVGIGTAPATNLHVNGNVLVDGIGTLTCSNLNVLGTSSIVSLPGSYVKSYIYIGTGTETLATTKTILTNDTTPANTVLYSFTLPGGRHLINGNVPYKNVTGMTLLGTNNWANMGLYANCTPATFNTSCNATPFVQLNIASGTDYLAQDFSFFQDISATTNYVVAVTGYGHSLLFGNPSGLVNSSLTAITVAGLGSQDSYAVRTALQPAPVRYVEKLSAPKTVFPVVQSGWFTAYASNADVFINGKKLGWLSTTSNDYSLTQAYDSVANTSTFTITLNSTGNINDVIEANVWPVVTSSTAYTSGYLYQQFNFTGPWQTSAPANVYVNPGSLVGIGTSSPFTGTTADIQGTLNVQNGIIGSTAYGAHLIPSAANGPSIIKWMQATTSVCNNSWWATGSYATSWSNVPISSTAGAFSSALYIPDGRVVFSPFNSTAIGFFNPHNNSYSAYTPTSPTIPGAGAFAGSVLTPSGQVVFVPYTSLNIGIYTPTTNNYTTVSRGTGSAAFYGGCLLPNGSVVFAPYNSTAIGLFNPTTGVYSTVGTITGTGAGAGAYAGAVMLPDGRCLFAPYNATTIGIYNYSASTINGSPSGYSTIDGTGVLTGSAVYFGAVLMADGRVALVPYAATALCFFNPTTNTLATTAYTRPSATAYRGGVALPDGKIAFIPFTGGVLGLYNPLTSTYSTVTGPNVAVTYSGGVVIPDGRVICTPYAGSDIGVFSQTLQTPFEMALHPFFNKF